MEAGFHQLNRVVHLASGVVRGGGNGDEENNRGEEWDIFDDFHFLEIRPFLFFLFFLCYFFSVLFAIYNVRLLFNYFNFMFAPYILWIIFITINSFVALVKDA